MHPFISEEQPATSSRVISPFFASGNPAKCAVVVNLFGAPHFPTSNDDDDAAADDKSGKEEGRTGENGWAEERRSGRLIG